MIQDKFPEESQEIKDEEEAVLNIFFEDEETPFDSEGDNTDTLRGNIFTYNNQLTNKKKDVSMSTEEIKEVALQVIRMMNEEKEEEKKEVEQNNVDKDEKEDTEEEVENEKEETNDSEKEEDNEDPDNDNDEDSEKHDKTNNKKVKNSSASVNEKILKMEKLIKLQNKSIEDLTKKLASLARVDNGYSYDSQDADKTQEMTLHF